MKKKMQDKRDESGVLKKNFKTFCRPQHEGERERERERESKTCSKERKSNRYAHVCVCP